MGYSRYDPADFIVPPSLKSGQSERIQARIQSGHFRALGVVAHSGVFPFQERSDVIRWSIKLGLEKINSMEPKLIQSVIRQANMAIELAREEVQRTKFEELFNEITQATNFHVGTGHRDQARQLLNKVREQIDLMPNEPESELQWKLRYLNRLDSFKHLEEEK